MLIVPYRPDAPVDHFQWGTIGLIVANTAVAVALGFPEPGPGSLIDTLTLRFGALNPLTWVTCLFVHYDWSHLVFNMIFLWSFGLVVEGLIGWRRFIPAYLAIGAAGTAVMQIVMLGATRGEAAGSSGAIFGIMAMAALWAPQNKLHTFLWILFYVRTVEVTVAGFALFFIGMNLLFALLVNFRMSSEVAHLLGAAGGLGVGVWMLRNKLVDTGGWDWISLRRGRPVTIVVGPGPATKRKATSVDALVLIREALEKGDAVAADARYASARKADAGFSLPHDDFRRLVEALARLNAPQTAIERMEEYLHAYPEGPVRVTLVRLLIRAKRPQRALDHLAALDPATDVQREAKSALEAEARAALGSSGLELE